MVESATTSRAMMVLVLASRAMMALVPAAGVAALLLGLVAVPAEAHSDLLQGSPGPGQRVGGTVDFVDLVFTEPVTEASVVVTGPDGATLTGRVTVAEGHLIRYAMDPVEVVGTYTVAYSIRSTDTDPVESSFVFDYHPDALQPTRISPSTIPDDGIALTSWLAGAALAAMVVGAAALVNRRRDAIRSPV